MKMEPYNAESPVLRKWLLLYYIGGFIIII